MSIGVRALEIARQHLGQAETEPNQGPIVDWALAGLSSSPASGNPARGRAPGWARWCAFFACQCLRQAAQDDITRHRILRLASGDCDRLWRNLSLEDTADHWTWLAVSPEARTPPEVRPGCLIFLGGHGDIQHVSFVHRLENGWVEELGGNIGDAVRLRRRPLTDPTIYGYGEVRLP